MKILYFGNPYLKEDNLAIKICEKLKNELKNIEFRQIKDTFQLVDEKLDDSIIIDTIKGLNKVKEIKPEQIEQGNIASLHDFDLGFFLKLKKTRARIIGIPQNYNEENALKEVKSILRTG